MCTAGERICYAPTSKVVVRDPSVATRSRQALGYTKAGCGSSPISSRFDLLRHQRVFERPSLQRSPLSGQGCPAVAADRLHAPGPVRLPIFEIQRPPLGTAPSDRLPRHTPLRCGAPQTPRPTLDRLTFEPPVRRSATCLATDGLSAPSETSVRCAPSVACSL